MPGLVSSTAQAQRSPTCTQAPQPVSNPCDCECRPGPRLVDALEFLVGLLNDKPELIPADFPWFYHKPSQQATAEQQ